VLGRFLFRWRGAIGVLAFGVLFWMARPTFGSCLIGLPLLLAGLAIRFWASGYIGIEGRVREIGGQREERGVRREEEGTPRRRITTGPYRTLRHPLYIGNFTLVIGMLVALRPALRLAVVVLAGFVLEYAMIVVEEERDLAGRRSETSDVKCEMSEERDGEGREATGDGREAVGEKFSSARAMCEWRTWVATAVGLGLALLKATVRS
jgi:protein-S-isoprenylcysteine O-methyltransferase Ste14